MTDIYQHELHKFADAGLNLRVPPDLVPASAYTKLTNATPIIEGRLEGRAAVNWLVQVANITAPGSGMHSLTRLNQASVAVVGDRLAGVDTTVQTFPLPAGNVAVSRDVNRTADPLSLPNFHFNADTPAWQIICDRQGMQKYRGGTGTGYYGVLGVYQPQNPVSSAAAGAAGNLNNGAGPAYDWVYTHVFTPTQSESNPSFASFNGNEDVVPSANTTPDAGFGGSAATAISNTTATLNASSATESRQSANWTPWNAAANQPYQQLYLDIAGSFVVTGTSGTVYGAIYFSLDAGKTWRLYVDCASGTVSFGIPSTTSFGTILLPANQDLTQLQVRAVVLSCGNISASQNVIARRIRDRAGNFPIADLLVGANATNRAMALTISTIHTHGVQNGATVSTLALANQKANLCIIDPRTLVPAFPVDALRLYRRGGSVTASWAFVQQYSLASLVVGPCGANQLQVIDNVADANLGGFVFFTNDAPVTSVFVLQRPLPYVWGPAFNPSRLLGCGDPDRPDSVYFSNPGNADQWGIGQWIDVSSPSDPMQNGCVYNTRTFAFSKERMFELVPSLVGGTTLTPFETPCRRGLISPYGLVSTARAVYFVAKDGVYATDGGVEQSIVENDIKPLFPTLDAPGRSVEGYDAVNLERIEDIRLRYHNDELWFIYRGVNTGLLQYLIYDQNKSRWRAASFNAASSLVTVYSEEAGPQSSLLAGDAAGNLYQFQGGTGDVLSTGAVPILVSVQTGAFDQGMQLNLKEYGNIIFDLDPGGATVANPVVITPLLNAELITDAAINVTGSGRQQVPLPLGDVFGFNIEFLITFPKTVAINPVLYQIDVLWRPEPASLTHFETREMSYGMPGFGHARDAYVAIRSSSNVTLTITADGVATTYTIPSTGGQRRKQYVPLFSNKGKVFKTSLDSADSVSQFRLYVEDCELRLKPWVTSLGYQVIKAWGAESQLVTPAFESQLLGGGR